MRFFTSDTHFGHFNIIGYSDRPWTNVEEMNAGLIERWNSVVSPDDTVWHMGDVVMSEKFLPLVSQLNGDIHLVAGNHDKCWDGHKKGKEAATGRYIVAGFSTIVTTGVYPNFALDDGRRVTLSHLPYTGDHHDTDRYEDYRPKDQGQINLCGHVHEKWKIQGRSINVGVDVWDWTPVSEDEIIEYINENV